MKVFIDTSGFVAVRNASEQESDSARATLASLIGQRATLITSNYVFSETYTTLLSRVGSDEAIAWGLEFRSGRVIELVHIDIELEGDAWRILETHEDKKWSYVDATSFALMSREGITDAFAFDRHFEQRGLNVIP